MIIQDSIWATVGRDPAGRRQSTMILHNIIYQAQQLRSSQEYLQAYLYLR
jgi:hypothetical protein